MPGQLEVRLWAKEDRNGDEFLIGDARDIPALVDLRECTFLVFYPPDEEDMEIEQRRHATLIIRGNRRGEPRLRD